MPKVKISEYSATANSNTDVASINIDEGCAPSGINNAIRAVMGHLKDFQQGTYGDPFNGPVNGTVGATTASTAVVTTLNSTDATDASSTTAAAMKTAGGLAVAKKMFVGLDANIYGLTVGRGAGAVASNTAVGASALAANTTGAGNVAVGYQAGYSNTASDNTFVGYVAGYANTSGTENVIVGRSAGRFNTTGSANSALGFAALYSTTTGSNNTAIGQYALQANTTASNNTAVGYQAGYSNTIGALNNFIGYQAGYSYNHGTADGSSLFCGSRAGYSQTSGIYNTYVGEAAGYSMTTGGKNTIIGRYTGNQGGLDIRTASNYIVLSDGDGNPRFYSANGSANVFIGETGNFVDASYNRGTGSQLYTDFRVGWTSAASPGTQTGYISTNGTTTSYVTTSDYRLKNTATPMTGALAKVALLKPCTYKWNADGSDGEGFIAHELAEVCPHAVTGEKDAVDEDGNPKYQGIDVSFLVATLTAAIQELKAEVDSLKAQINGASA